MAEEAVIGSEMEQSVAKIDAMLAPKPAPEAEEPQPEQPQAEEDAPVEAEAAAEVETEDSAEEATEADEPEAPAIDPPISWSDADKATFSTLPPEAQKVISDREREREAAFTQKTQQLSEFHREAAQELQGQRQHNLEKLEPLIEQLQAMVTQGEVDLDALLETDPEEYVRQKAYADKRMQAFQAAQAERDRMQEQQAEEQRQLLRQDMLAQEAEIGRQFPAWAKNPDEGKKRIAELRSFAKSHGVPEEQAESFYHAAYFTVLDKAQKWDALQKSKVAVNKKVQTVPKVQKPGTPKTKSEGEADKRAADRARFRKTQKQDDAVRVIERFIS